MRWRIPRHSGDVKLWPRDSETKSSDAATPQSCQSPRPSGYSLWPMVHEEHLRRFRMRYLSVLLCGCAAMLVCSTPISHGADKPAAGESGVSIGEMRIQTIPAMTYLYTPAE